MKRKLLPCLLLCLLCPLLAGCQGSGNSSADAALSASSSGEPEDAALGENAANEVTDMYITIQDNRLKVQLADNTSADALVDILRQNDITYTADDYGGFEKVGNIGYTLPRNDEQITTEAGDVILYQGNSLCLYYDVNTWSFTRIGRIEGYSTSQLKELLRAGMGSVEVTISLNEK